MNASRLRLTLLFTDLSGSTALGERLEAERFAHMLGRLRQIIREVVDKHHGLVLRTQGDGALVAFGLPEPREEDLRNAVQAALDIHARVRELVPDDVPADALPLQMHSGVHAGIVLVSDGDMDLGRFELVGDAVNVAAALSAHAEASEVLVCAATLGRDRLLFDTAAARNIPLARRPGGLAVVAVSGTRTTRGSASTDTGRTPFVGREGLLAELRASLHGARSGLLRDVVLIEGGPGVGKSRLLDELFPPSPPGDWQVLRGYCERHLGAEVLQPFLQILRSLCEVDPTMAAPQVANAVRRRLAAFAGPHDLGSAPVLAALAVEGDLPARRSHVVGDLAEFFSALAAQERLVLVIDDWQWADDASRQLVDAMLNARTDLVLVLASRPQRDGEAGGVAGARRFELAPFSLAETAKASQHWMETPSPFLVEEIHRYAGGVPLFVEELCHAVAADAQGHGVLPRAVRATGLMALVASRLARLPESQAAIVRAAAVIGTEIPAWLLERLIGRSCDDPMVRELSQLDFLFPAPQPGMLRFKHGIARDAVYETVGLHVRNALHLQIAYALVDRANAFEREDTLEALAYHSGAAGLTEQAIRYAELAGDKASAAFALDRARAQYLAAMQALDSLPTPSREQRLHWCALVHKLGMTCIFDPLALPASGLQVFELAVERARALADVATLARSAYWLGYMCYGLGRMRAAVAHGREALLLARAGTDERLVAQIEASLAEALVGVCQYDQALPLLDAAVDSKRGRVRPGGGLAIGSAYALACKGSVFGDRGLFDDAHSCFAEALALLGDTPHPVGNSVRNRIGLAFIWQGEWARAVAVELESTRIAENTRALLLLSMSRAFGGYARWCLDGDLSGVAQIREAVQWQSRRGAAFYTSLHHGWLVEASLACDESAQARHHAARLLVLARAHERIGEAHGMRALALHEAAGERFGAAARYLARAEASAALRQSPREQALNQACASQIARRQGRRAAAARAHDQAAQAFERMRMRWHAEKLRQAHHG